MYPHSAQRYTSWSSSRIFCSLINLRYLHLRQRWLSTNIIYLGSLGNKKGTGPPSRLSELLAPGPATKVPCQGLQAEMV